MIDEIISISVGGNAIMAISCNLRYYNCLSLTSDMRYKANKEAAKAAPAGPTKKDGTPDMRYKANKEAAAKKK